MKGNSSSKKSASKKAVGQANQPAPEGQLTIKDLLRQNKNTIAQALESTPLTPERLLSVCMTELRENAQVAGVYTGFPPWLRHTGCTARS